MTETAPQLEFEKPNLEVVDMPTDYPLDGHIECKNCGKQFEPRTGSGGRPQKHCSTECRREYDTNAAQRGQRAGDNEKKMTMTQAQFIDASRAISEATLEGVKAGGSSGCSNDADFDWWKDDCVVLREQHSTAIYFNAEGGLVIRQQNWPEDDDVVIITKPCIDGFMDRLCDALEIGGSNPK